MLGAVALVACGSDRIASPISADAAVPMNGNLLAIDRFTSPEPSVDREASHRAEACAFGGPRIEDDTLELETDDCLLFWTGIPLLGATRAGEALTLVTTHGALAARAPAEAHIRVDLDGETLVDRRLPIPSPDAVDIETVTPSRDHGTGARLTVHLHNHGANSWRVVSLTRR